MRKNLWCDSMFCEFDTAWLVGAEVNAVFKLDFNTKKYKFITGFPNSSMLDFRVNNLCMKVKDTLYFFPDTGTCIWIYDIKSESFTKIEIDNPDKIRILISMAFCIDNSIYAISSGLGQIIEICVENKEIVGMYPFHQYAKRSQIGSEGCIVGKNIYFTVPEENIICEFSSKTKEMKSFYLDGNLMPQTISYLEDSFLLSGRTREIIRWNQKDQILSSFPLPDSVGAFELVGSCFVENSNRSQYQKPLFRWSLNRKDKIWFIPYIANEIIYFDKRNNQICICEIESEKENKESWLSHEQVKYRFECVFMEKYIFIYSFKNKHYLAIDALTDEVQIINIELENENDLEFSELILKECNKDGYFRESGFADIFDVLRVFNSKHEQCVSDVGDHIFQEIMSGV